MLDRLALRRLASKVATYAFSSMLGLALTNQVMAAPQSITLIDDAGKPVAGAAVSIFVKGTPTVANDKTAEIAQKDKQFTPNLMVIQTGTAVNFPNFDTVRHHVYSFSPIKTFEIKLYSGRPSAPIVFDKPGTAILGCNIHDGMVGFIHVVDTPYFGITNAQGKVNVDVPAGDYHARVWHPSMGITSPGKDMRLLTGSGPLTLNVQP